MVHREIINIQMKMEINKERRRRSKKSSASTYLIGSSHQVATESREVGGYL
jgi:hypothetical protein